MGKRVQYVSVAFRNTEKTYNYKAIIDKDGVLAEPLEQNDIVVCQVSAAFGAHANERDEVGFTIGVVVDDHMKANATATRFIVQKVDVVESDKLIGVERELAQKQKRRDKLYNDLREIAKQKEMYDKLGDISKGDKTAEGKLAELKALDEDLGNYRVEW